MKKILLVNSVKLFHEKNLSVLYREDLTILTAMKGREALAIHRRERVNLIISDLDLPDMSGEEFCSQVREDADLSDVSIVLVCEKSGREIERAERAGANEYLTLPIDKEWLLDLVGRYVAIPVRQAYRMLLKVTIDGRNGEETFFCASRNISATGMLIETERLYPLGEPITCSFFLQDCGQVVADAEIVRSVGSSAGAYLHGIRFTRMEPAAREAIEAFIAKARKRS